MKICLITFYYPPDLCAGSFRAEALVNALLKHNNKVTQIEIFSTTQNRYNSYQLQNVSDPVNKKLLIHRIFVPKHNSTFLGQSMAFLFFAVGIFFKLKGKNWDIIVCTSSRLMTAFLGALIAKKKKNRLYLDIRDLFVDTISDIFSKIKLKKFIFIFKYIEKWTFNRADKINIVSYGFYNYVRASAKKIPLSCFTNGVDEIFVRRKKLNKKKKFPKIINILYAGNIGSGQALHKIIPDFALSHPNLISITVVGDGGQRQKLENFINDRNIKNVKILNPVDRKKLSYYYTKADVFFLHLNKIHAFKKVLPSKIFEYACLGKPILAGVNGYASKFSEQEIKGCYIFKPCDLTSLQKVFKQTIEGKTIYDRDLFIKKYKRGKIMKSMANDIIETAK